MGGKVLSIASECVPLIKTGGLADVVGALPQALAPLGWQMRVLLPAYRALRKQISDHPQDWQLVAQEDDLWGGPAQIYSGDCAGLSLLLLDAPHLYDREGGPYGGVWGDHWDNAQRFAALSWMGAKIGREGIAGWTPDILHAHDWQAGYAPAYARLSGGPPSVMTIHNMAFQGWSEASALGHLRLPADEFHPEALEYYGGLSSLKAGLVYADKITTVSPNYARELMRDDFGLGLQGVIQARSADVQGILNGVDETIWSPQNEPENPYSATSLKGKVKAKSELCQAYGLKVSGPLAVLVSRLTDQKGIDLVARQAPDFIEAGGGLIVLGTGDAGLQEAMQSLARRFPQQVAAIIGYDEGLSHKLFQGGDAVLVPSRFEPCGLTQLYGLRYGTLPLVAAVGGLADTVINASPAALAKGVATGISFWPVDDLGLRQAFSQLITLYAQTEVWRKMVKQAMAQPVGWQASAKDYAALYQGLL